MASTNKTPNLKLSQFVSTDKPAWLTDYNADMTAIDTAVETNKEDIQANETAITSLGNDVSGLSSNVSTLSAGVSQHGTDITDLKAQDIIIKNDITNLGTRVTALENQEASVEVRDISSSFPKANIVKMTKYGKVVTLSIDGLTNVTAGSNNGVGQLPSDALPATHMNQDIVAANTGTRLRVYLPENGAIGFYNYGSETGTLQTQFIITYIAQ
jgi:hypothetical protein